MQGGHLVITNGLNASSRFMQSYVNLTGSTPTSGCTVTVYITGSGGMLATLTAATGNVTSNPFTADATGHWYFEAGNGNYDVTLSGGGIASPFTLGAIPLQDPYFTAPTNGTPRLISNKLGDSISVKDYGAKCDGSTNDTSSFVAALAENSAVTVQNGTCVVSAFTIPSQKALLIQAGGMLSIVSGQTVTFTGVLEAGAYQVFTGSGVTSINSGTAVQAAWFPGADLFAQVNAGILALGGACRGKIEMPKGSFVVTTTINAAQTAGCDIGGQGSVSGGAQTGTQILWEGNSNARIIDGRSSSGFHLHDFQLILAGTTTFNGIGADFSHDTSGIDASIILMERTAWFGLCPSCSTSAMFDIIVNLDKAISSRVFDNVFQGGRIGVQGVAPMSAYSNAISIENNIFSSTTGTISEAMIYSPGEAWTIINNTFEMGTMAGTPFAVECPNRVVTQGVSFIGNWVGDWGAGAVNPTNLQVCGGPWFISGNLFGTDPGTAATNFQITNDAVGVHIASNIIITNSLDTIISLGNDDQQIFVDSNFIGPIATFLSGTPASGLITDNLGVTRSYGPAAGVGLTGAISMLNPTDCSGLVMTVGGSGPYICGGFGGTTIAKQYIGDGTGYTWQIVKRSGGVDTVLGSFTDLGVFTWPTVKFHDSTEDNLHITTSISVGGAAGTDHGGFTGDVTVKGSAGTNCVMSYEFGILYNSTCP